MAATSSMVQHQFSLSPSVYPDQFSKTSHYPSVDPSYQTSSQMGYQYKDMPGTVLPMSVPGQHPYSYQFMQGYQMEQSPSINPSWTYGAAIQGIVPEPERFGDLCEKGLVPIITTPAQEVTNPCNNSVTPAQLNPPIKSEPLKVVPQQSCETTYVTTSQPLMCHSTMAPNPATLEYNYTPCTNDQIGEQVYQGGMGWSPDMDPFYSTDMRSLIPGSQLPAGSNGSSTLPSPWDYYRTSNT